MGPLLSFGIICHFDLASNTCNKKLNLSHISRFLSVYVSIHGLGASFSYQLRIRNIFSIESRFRSWQFYMKHNLDLSVLSSALRQTENHLTQDTVFIKCWITEHLLVTLIPLYCQLSENQGTISVEFFQTGVHSSWSICKAFLLSFVQGENILYKNKEAKQPQKKEFHFGIFLS